MAQRQRSFSVLETPDRIWAALSDPGAWEQYLPYCPPQYYGWGRRFRPLDAMGAGARLQMLHGEEVVQDWTVAEWQPPQRLKLASTAWHGRSELRMASSVTVEVASLSPVESTVTLTLETAFTHPLFGLLMAFTPLTPLGRALNSGLAHMERGILARLDGGK